MNGQQVKGVACIASDARTKVIEQSLPLYRAIKQRAFEGTTSPRGAIKAMCLECLADSRNAIRDCSSKGCPLWAYRPYQPDAPNLMDDDRA